MNMKTRRAKFTAPIQVVERPEIRARVMAIAEAEGVSQAEILRDLHEHGIEWREEVSRRRLAARGASRE